ncbi:MAG TPA: hypothetical protein VIJ20_03675, partial [Solirubrobacteraceae bacterium]
DASSGAGVNGRRIAERTGLLATNGGGLRIELLATIKAQAVEACDRTRAGRAGAIAAAARVSA